MNEQRDLTDIITKWLGEGATIQDFKNARDGDKSIGRGLADAILAEGYSKQDYA